MQSISNLALETFARSPAGKRHPLLEGVFTPGAKPRWWLETESYLFTVKGRHKILVESRALGAQMHRQIAHSGRPSC